MLPHPPRSFVAAVAGLSSMDMQSGIVPLRSSPSALWHFPCCLSSSRRTVGKKPFLKARRMITVAHRVNRLHQWLFGNFHFAVSVCLDGLPFSVQLVVLGLYIRQQIEQIKLRQLGGLPGAVCPVAGAGPPRDLAGGCQRERRTAIGDSQGFHWGVEQHARANGVTSRQSRLPSGKCY